MDAVEYQVLHLLDLEMRLREVERERVRRGPDRLAPKELRRREAELLREVDMREEALAAQYRRLSGA